MRTRFLLNNLLTFVWVALTGTFTGFNLVLGFVLGFWVLWIIDRKDQNRRYFRVVPRAIGFLLYFFYELIKANLEVAYQVLTPSFSMDPGIVRVPLDVRSDFEITLLANVISLTPGTLSLDVSTDRRVLYVHAMYVGDKEEFIQGIKNGFERRILTLLR
ncbi:MAG: Na+/H+ antiporter subunit E [Bacteroidota bacterium]